MGSSIMGWIKALEVGDGSLNSAPSESCKDEARTWQDLGHGGGLRVVCPGRCPCLGYGENQGCKSRDA